MNEPEKTRTKFHIPPKNVKKRRGILKWLLAVLLILIIIAFFQREWIGFQIRALKAEYGASETRTQALRWFINNRPREARHVFFRSFIKDPQLRDLAVEGLLESDQKELITVYLHLWHSDSTDKELKDKLLELLADHSADRGLLLFLDPSMVLSADSSRWALAYDYLNANPKSETVDYLVSSYYAGKTQTRRTAITALSYLRENAILSGRRDLRPLLESAMDSPDREIRLRACQTFGCIANIMDIPPLVLKLSEEDREIAQEAGKTLRYLGKLPEAGESPAGKSLQEFALAAAAVADRGYGPEIEQQLGESSLVRLRNLAISGRQEDIAALARNLAERTRLMLEDIDTARFVSLWNLYERSTILPWMPSDSEGSWNFGIAVSAETGKINYRQITSSGAGRVIYCTSSAAWEDSYETERNRLRQHQMLADKAGLEQIIRLEISSNLLERAGTVALGLERILNTALKGEGAKARFLEIALDPGTDPVASYKKYAAVIEEAAATVRRRDASVKLFMGPIPLGDRRWYGTAGAVESLILHRFADGKQLRDMVEGISVSSNLSPESLKTELSEFVRSLRMASAKPPLLWCTQLGQGAIGARSTTARLESDYLCSLKKATELPACLSLLANAGVTVVIFGPLKDSPLRGSQGTFALDGLLTSDCMPRPVYHVSSLLIHALGNCDLGRARMHSSSNGVAVTSFPSEKQPVFMAWAEKPGQTANLKVKSPYARITRMVPDALGNFRSSITAATGGEISVPLDEGAVLVEQLSDMPPPPGQPIGPDNPVAMTELDGLAGRLGTRCASYGTHDRSGDNDDGFSGTSSYLYRKDNGEYVIFDAEGPGVIRRFWLRLGGSDKVSRIRFYFDDESKPGIDVTPEEMFEGNSFPFRHPLVASGKASGGGSVSSVPIWFSKRLVIATVGTPRFCQVDYCLHESPAGIRNSTMNILKGLERELATLAVRLGRDAGNMHSGCPGAKELEETILPPGGKAEVITFTGPAVIKCLRVECAKREDMEQIILQIYWDGSETAGVGSSLADIFGQKGGTFPWLGLTAGFSGTEGYIHYPMPFTKSARIVLTNRGSDIARATVRACITRLPRGTRAERYFCCHSRTAIAGPGESIRLLSVKGAGHYVGCMVGLDSLGEISYLDSDIMAFADSTDRSVMHSTGIDDYFGGANFYEGGPFTLPMSGLLQKHEATTIQYRFYASDAMVFEKSFLLVLEALPPDSRQTVLSGAFFWYSEAPEGGDLP